MTSRQRFLACLSGEAVDRPFLWESGFWTAAVDRWRGEGLPARADPYEALGLERIACAGIDYEPDPPFAERVVRDEDDSVLIESESGARLRRLKRQTVPGDSRIPLEVPLRFPVRDRASWARMRERLDPTSPRRADGYRAFLDEEAQCPAPNGGLSASFDPADGFATAFYILMPTYWLVRHAGFENAAILLYDDFALVEEITTVYAEFLAVQLGEILAKRVPDAVFLNESSAASGAGMFMAPEMYRRLALPAIERLASMCRSAGVPFVFIHCGGQIKDLVPLWKETGVNGLLPLEAPTDVVSLARDHGEMALVGGIDRRALEGDRAAIEREVRRKAGALRAHGRAIPSADAHYAISDAVSFANMRFYIDLLREISESAR